MMSDHSLTKVNSLIHFATGQCEFHFSDQATKCKLCIQCLVHRDSKLSFRHRTKVHPCCAHDMAGEWPFFFIQQIIKYASNCIVPLLCSILLSLEEAHYNSCCSHGRSMLCPCCAHVSEVNGHFIFIQQIAK